MSKFFPLYTFSCLLHIDKYLHIDFLDIIIKLVNENQLVQVLSLVSD